MRAPIDIYYELYWRIVEKRLRKMCSGRKPEILYVRRYRTYTATVDPQIFGGIESVVGDLVNWNLLYIYKLGNKYHHTHEFRFVLKEAYEHPYEFSIFPYDLREYSGQEIEFLKRAVARGKEDMNVADTDVGKHGWRR